MRNARWPKEFEKKNTLAVGHWHHKWLSLEGISLIRKRCRHVQGMIVLNSSFVLSLFVADVAAGIPSDWQFATNRWCIWIDPWRVNLAFANKFRRNGLQKKMMCLVSITWTSQTISHLLELVDIKAGNVLPCQQGVPSWRRTSKQNTQSNIMGVSYRRGQKNNNQ